VGIDARGVVIVRVTCLTGDGASGWKSRSEVGSRVVRMSRHSSVGSGIGERERERERERDENERIITKVE
jgi:hypothetical protein